MGTGGTFVPEWKMWADKLVCLDLEEMNPEQDYEVFAFGLTKVPFIFEGNEYVKDDFVVPEPHDSEDSDSEKTARPFTRSQANKRRRLA